MDITEGAAPEGGNGFDPSKITVNRELGGTSKPEERPRRGRRAKRDLGDGQVPPDGTANGSDAPKRRYTRKKKALDPLEVEKLAKQLKGVHVLCAMATGISEFQLSDTEAHMLAESFATVSREYDVEFNGKTAATVQLIGTACLIYLPRLGAIQQKMKAKRARATVDAEVVNGTAAAS